MTSARRARRQQLGAADFAHENSLKGPLQAAHLDLQLIQLRSPLQAFKNDHKHVHI